MNERLSLPNYGGQAVIEGVMMRGAKSVAIAMRAPDKKIVVHTEPLGSIYKSRLSKIPFLRGLVMLWDALGLGMRALTISANVQVEEEVPKASAEARADPAAGESQAPAIVKEIGPMISANLAAASTDINAGNIRQHQPEKDALGGPVMYATMGVSLLIGVAIFLLFPAAIGQLAERFLHWNAWYGNLVEGLVRLGLLVGYIALVGRIPEIQRVFAYHGAEHKTINAFEAGVELTPENVSRFSVEHPRCGTAFLLTLVVLSVILFSLLGPLPAFWRLASRILLLPVLAGLAYEYIRWTARHLSSPLVRLIVRPNLALQHLTTREPSLDMLEVSITALNAMRREEEQLHL